MKTLLAVALAFCLGSVSAIAAEVRITKEMKSVSVSTEDGDVVIKRNPDEKNTINPAFAKTSRKCPPFCIQPFEVAPGVKTVGELEVINFLKNKKGVVVDARTVEWHVRGTIPGAKNIPFTQVASRLNELGCAKSNGKWDCANAKDVLLFCNGLWCGQSPTAIRAMLREGYPASKINYYRGGMQGWESVGLTVVEGSM
ncbi:MAG: rhodanese-like domain-containing protein [Alphaproteobacteria bacterium]|jgi:rhodanese-related sulfurtransferase|nr:rhodanese-like domain-containing protein [Alphaproteobacteria bacterium]MDP6255242.1 rhodanese-like domain-containing protein [Alphaproteobacteria bacterium]MDP7053848.1 rhodanese-like domain-containing protein [Alphaproteobacteria bacterium]MDP7227181.1 rhodanese-like domain-containing protein [Alphaproteobacteria bacterium]MDP7461145.1 rhodanese-like domain-containing protein [Alphaproteobacteria bacterium]|tara:strand:- start:131 stop:724 length:594 start_codon:yes stop_codon:yes gene_type:complete